MTWVRLDDQFADSPKLERAGPVAGWLHVAALCYCARHLTDGVVPWEKAARLIPAPGRHLAALVRENVWHKPGHECESCPPCPERHYILHDYLDYQPSRAQVETERAAARERMAKARRNKRGSSPEHPPNVPENNGRSSDNPDPTRPDTEDLPPPENSRGAQPDPGGEGSESIVDQAVKLAAERYGHHEVTQGRGKSSDGLARWWLQENADGARLRARKLLDEHDLGVTQLADALTQPNPPWLRHYRRRVTPGDLPRVLAVDGVGQARAQLRVVPDSEAVS